MPTAPKISAAFSAYGEPQNITGTTAPTANVLDDLPRNPQAADQRYQLWVWASNTDTVRRLLTVLLGTSQVTMWIPPQSGLNNVVVPGIPVLAPLTVAAFADTTGVINVVTARKALLSDSEFQP